METNEFAAIYGSQELLIKQAGAQRETSFNSFVDRFICIVLKVGVTTHFGGSLNNSKMWIVL